MILLAVSVWVIMGTIIGRVLFRQRLGTSARYSLGKAYTDYGSKFDAVIDQFDLTSAKTYGLWSIPLWPLTLAVFFVQLPTPEEKKIAQTEKHKELIKEYDLV